MKIIQIIGTRPQFVKCIPELGKVVNTGQHWHTAMIDVRDKFDYETVKHQNLVSYLEQEKPDMVVVYGDTKSTLWGAEAAHKLGIPIAHIEAGIRDESAKVENKIRKKVDRMANINFAPTMRACENLSKEKLPYTFVGDVMYDDYLYSRIHAGYALVTIHRAENANQKIIDQWMSGIVHDHERVYVILHHRTKKFFKKWKNRVHLLEPMDHDTMLFKLREAEMVYTDSGGLQKEAYWSGCPVQTIGGNPWPEIYAFGEGDAKEKIIKYVKEYLNETKNILLSHPE